MTIPDSGKTTLVPHDFTPYICTWIWLAKRNEIRDWSRRI